VLVGLSMPPGAWGESLSLAVTAGRDLHAIGVVTSIVFEYLTVDRQCQPIFRQFCQ
jgi:hypothetical protein